jgi:hypothetical protein
MFAVVVDPAVTVTEACLSREEVVHPLSYTLSVYEPGVIVLNE